MRKNKLAENTLRTELRKYIKAVMKEQEEKEAPEQDSEENSEEKSNAELDSLKTRFVGKMKSIQGATDMETMIQSFSDILNGFGMSSEQKLNLLKGIKSNIVQ
jgi:hypothetical protein